MSAIARIFMIAYSLILFFCLTLVSMWVAHNAPIHYAILYVPVMCAGIWSPYTALWAAIRGECWI